MEGGGVRLSNLGIQFGSVLRFPWKRVMCSFTVIYIHYRYHRWATVQQSTQERPSIQNIVVSLLTFQTFGNSTSVVLNKEVVCIIFRKAEHGGDTCMCNCGERRV